MAEPTIAHWRKYGKYEAFKFWTHPPVTPQCIVSPSEETQIDVTGCPSFTSKLVAIVHLV